MQSASSASPLASAQHGGKLSLKQRLESKAGAAS